MRTRNQQSKHHGTMTALIGLAALVLAPARPVLAQSCNGTPTPGSRLALSRPITLYPLVPGRGGDNLVAIPAFSPVNDPSSGFKQLCDIFGLTGTTSTITQIDASTGTLHTHACSNLVQSERFQPCQAVLIRSSVLAKGIIPLRAASATESVFEGVDGSWSYPIYGDSTGPLGDNLFGVPLNASDVDGDGALTAADICTGLGLKRNHSTVVKVDAATGTSTSYTCGKPAPFAVYESEGLILRSSCSRAELAGSLCAIGQMPVD